jgi:Lower baseplate protein N-terminal domain
MVNTINYNITGKPTTISGYGIADAALDSTVVHLAGTETITGVKTFNNKVILGYTSGNILIGTNTDAGYKLDVNGTARVQTSLLVGNTSGQAASSMFEVQSTTQGMLIPRMTTTQMLAISSPANGLKIFNTTEQSEWFYTTDWGWESNSKSYQRKYGFEYYNDFGSTPVTDGTFGTSGTTTVAVGDVNRFGVIQFSTSTTTTGSARIATDASTANGVILSGGKFLYETSVKIPTLSTVSEEFSFAFGFTGNTVTPTITNGILFSYDRLGVATGSAASANWQVATGKTSVRSYTTTSVPVVAGQWYKLTMIINAAATQVDFYIDDVLVKSETNNIGTQGGLTAFILKSAGTTARTMQLDYLYIKQKYTTAK